MCVISAVYDSLRQQVPIDTWTPATYALLQQILKKLEELDKKLGLKDCEDPGKAEILKDIEAVLAKHKNT